MYLKNVVVDKPKGAKMCPVGKTVYVYHVLESTYDPSRKYNTDKRVSIGKMVSGSKTKMVPNDRFGLYYPELLTAAIGLPDPPLFSQTLYAGAVVAVRRIAQDLGLLRILSNIYGSTLDIYRGRDNIEKFFRGIKSRMNFDSPGVHDDQSLAAKIHLIFIAGIIRNRFNLASAEIKKSTGNKKSYTVPAMIDQLEQIESSFCFSITISTKYWSTPSANPLIKQVKPSATAFSISRISAAFT